MSRSSSSASIALFPTPTTSTTGGQLLWWENYHFCGWQTTFVPVCVTNQTMGPHSCAMHLWFSWIIYRLFNISISLALSISSRNCSHHVPCMVGFPPLSSSWNITKGTESHFFMFLVSSVFRFVDMYVFVIVFWFLLLRVCRNTSLSSLSFSCTLSFYYCFPNRTRWSKEHEKKKNIRWQHSKREYNYDGRWQEASAAAAFEFDRQIARQLEETNANQLFINHSAICPVRTECRANRQTHNTEQTDKWYGEWSGVERMKTKSLLIAIKHVRSN